MNDKNKINCKFINGKVRNMELPILLKEKLEQEIDEIELKKLKQSAQNISEKYRDKSSNKMSTRLIASREDAVAYAVSRMPATYGAVCFALKHSLEMMPYAEITSLLDVGAGTGTATWAVNELLKIESNICVEKLTILISTLILVFILLILGIIALFYLSFTLAYVLAPHVGGLMASYGIITGCIILLILLIVLFRKRLIVQPMVNFLANLLLNDN